MLVEQKGRRNERKEWNVLLLLWEPLQTWPRNVFRVSLMFLRHEHSPLRAQLSEKQLNLNVITSAHYLLRRSGQFYDVIPRSGAWFHLIILISWFTTLLLQIK
jgi:hypothetical protein